MRTALCGRTALNPAPCHRSKHRRRFLFPNSRTSGPSRPRPVCCSCRVHPGSRTTRGQRSWSFVVNPQRRCHFSLVGVEICFLGRSGSRAACCASYFDIHVLLPLPPLAVPPSAPTLHTPLHLPTSIPGIHIGIHSHTHTRPLLSTPCRLHLCAQHWPAGGSGCCCGILEMLELSDTQVQRWTT